MIKNSFPLGLHWPTMEPFLFCAHHLDLYPRGQSSFGPDRRFLQGRDLGMDFEAKDGFRMYHGEEVPGFPVHPHRGFETITIVRKGFVDHSDSLGAAGRYGEGDVQWLTAGSGIQHSEMFPLLRQDQDNTCELFQIWLNLPRRSKMAAPHFTMFWSEEIPKIDLDSLKVSVSLIAGEYNQTKSLTPPPESWASDISNEVLVMLVKIKSGGLFQLPKARGPVNRTLYFFSGTGLQLNGQQVSSSRGFEVDGSQDLELRSQSDDTEILVLQARPIGEPVVQRGPFVMNSPQEIIQTIHDYQQTGFGGWPWPRQDMVHGPDLERFARFPDGKIVRRKVQS
jgi:redox-sensitive bicupin YhaK (pirin superfamily)